jgi:hypothetical protein
VIKLKKTPTGYVVPILVSPGASRDEVRGEHGGRMKVAVSAPPEGGKANKAVCQLLAEELGTRTSQVRIVSGQTSRQKEVLVERVTTDALDEIIS